GLSPLEAALRGCALVLSDIGSFRELWEGCAEFFRKGSATSLAEVLAELLAGPTKIPARAQQARQRALDRYTADRFAADYMSLYAGMRNFGARRARLSVPAAAGPVHRRSDPGSSCD